MSIRLPTDRHLPNGRQPAKEGSLAEELANQSIVMAQQSPASMASQLSRRQPKSLAFSGGCSSSRKMSRCSPDGGNGREGSRPCSGPEVSEPRLLSCPYIGDAAQGLPWRSLWKHSTLVLRLAVCSQATYLDWGNQEQGTRCTLHQVVPLTFFQKYKCSSALEEDSACVWRQVGSCSSFLTS